MPINSWIQQSSQKIWRTKTTLRTDCLFWKVNRILPLLLQELRTTKTSSPTLLKLLNSSLLASCSEQTKRSCQINLLRKLVNNNRTYNHNFSSSKIKSKNWTASLTPARPRKSLLRLSLTRLAQFRNRCKLTAKSKPFILSLLARSSNSLKVSKSL